MGETLAKRSADGKDRDDTRIERLMHSTSGAIALRPAATFSAAVSVAVIAAVCTAVFGFMISLYNRRVAKREAYKLEVRTRAAAVFELLFVIQHAVEWVTWYAVYRPFRVNQDLSSKYEKEVHGALPAVLGALGKWRR
jgi:hypothetical protein